MPVTRDMLLSELKDLQRLTAVEQTVATVRRTQAATATVAAELAANAEASRERLVLLGQAVRTAGGSPDLVGPVLGRLLGLVQTQVAQVQTLQGALLGDLALEHQLRDRARYARTLAVTLGEVSVLPVLDRLDRAHGDTIAWLEARLGEVARTGSAALAPTPVQQAVGGVRRLVGAPFAAVAAGVNAAAGLVGRLTGPAGPAVGQAVGQVEEAAAVAVQQVSGQAEAVVQAAADQVRAAEAAAEQAAAQVAGQVLAASGDEGLAEPVAAAKPPFAAYERLTGDSVMRHVDDTEDVEELRVLLAFEQAHKARKGVVTAAQRRLAELAG